MSGAGTGETLDRAPETPPVDPRATLGALLRRRGLSDPAILALRLTLNRADRAADFASLDDVVRAGALGAYERMQDGARLGRDSRVLTFLAEPGGRARLAGFRRFTLRRRGLVPGDIVYDYEAAHLLHSFLARARCPVFYDAIDEAGLDDLIGRLVLDWPRPHLRAIRPAHDPAIRVVVADAVGERQGT